MLYCKVTIKNFNNQMFNINIKRSLFPTHLFYFCRNTFGNHSVYDHCLLNEIITSQSQISYLRN